MTPIIFTPLAGALQVAGFSIRVFPVWDAPNGVCACPDGPKCTSPGKHPIQRSWQANSTTESKQILAWSKRWPTCNWGLRTDDLTCADVDPRAGGTLEAVQAKLPATGWVVETGGGGWHLGYLPPTTGSIKGGNNLLGPGLDVKAKGGFVVAPGSIHATGHQYTWQGGEPPDPDAISPWPVLEIGEPGRNGDGPGGPSGAPSRSTLAALLAEPPSFEGEGRNVWLSKVAGHVFRHFPHDDGAIELIRSLNAGLDAPLQDQEVGKILHSIVGTDDEAREARFREAVAKRAWTMKVALEAKRELNRESWREPPATLIGHEWLAHVYEQDPWSVVDLLPAGGNALLAAQFKVGKTTLLLNLMQAMCDNRPFLGRYSAWLEQGARVGYFNYELPAAMLQRWTAALEIQNPNRFVVANLRGYGVRLGTPEGDEWAVQWLRQYDVQMWIIDPYAMAFAGESENDNTEVARFTDSIDQIKERADVDSAVLGAHFGRQSFEAGDEHVRGATRLDDWADARWIMVKNEDDRFFSASGRDVLVEESRLSYSSQSKRLTLMEGNRYGRGTEVLEGKILQYVARATNSKQGDEMRAAITKAAIEHSVEGKATRIRESLKRLLARGTLVLVTGPYGENWVFPAGHPEITQGRMGDG